MNLSNIKNIWKHLEFNPGQQSEKQKCYLYAMQPLLHGTLEATLLDNDCKVLKGKYLQNKEMRHNHLTVKQVHFIHTHKITLNPNKR